MITLLYTIGTFEAIVVVFLIALFCSVVNYGKDTVLGYSGSLLLAILTSPIVAFLIIHLVKGQKKHRALASRRRFNRPLVFSKMDR